MDRAGVPCQGLAILHAAALGSFRESSRDVMPGADRLRVVLGVITGAIGAPALLSWEVLGIGSFPMRPWEMTEAVCHSIFMNGGQTLPEGSGRPRESRRPCTADALKGSMNRILHLFA